jgi:hypothetical protein
MPMPTPTDGGTCSDMPLEGAWSAGGTYTCATFEAQGLANCGHSHLLERCCFCGGGSPSSPTPAPVPIPGGACSDFPLEGAWIAGGTYTCATFEAQGLANCGHSHLKEQCCFCGGGGRRLGGTTANLRGSAGQ